MNVNKVVYNGNTLVDLTGDTVTADNLASGVTAHAADGSSVTGLLPKVEIDSELSSTSTNPVQNKAVTEAINANKYTLPAAAYGKLGGVYLGYSMTNNATGLKIGGIEHTDSVKKLYKLTFSDDTTITAGGTLTEFTIEGLATEIKGNGLVLSPAGLNGKTGIYSRSGFSDPVQIINASDKQLVGNWTLEQVTPTANNGIASKSYVDSKTVTVDTTLSTSSTNAVQNKAVATSLNNKADKATTLAGYGITDAKIDNKTITLGGNTITLLTEHQDLSEYAKTADVDVALATKADDDEVLHNTKNVIPDTTNVLFEHESDKSWLGFLGGTDGKNGSSLFLNGANTGDNEAGRFELTSVDANKNVYTLSGESNGSLIWCGKHIVRSVNGTNADKSGNVTLTLPTKTSDLTNDSGYLTEHQDVSGKADKTYVDSQLATKADGSNVYSKSEVDSRISAIPKFNIEVVSSLPTSDISNSTVYLVKSGTDSQNLYTEYIRAGNAWERLGTQDVDLSGYVQKADLAGVATTGSYTDLLNKPTIPTKVSQLTNDSGYLTQHQSLAGYVKSTDLSAVAKSNSYRDLDDKPTIPDISGKVDRTDLSAVATSGKYADLSGTPAIPTKVSQLTNDSGYLVSADIAGKADDDTVMHVNSANVMTGTNMYLAKRDTNKSAIMVHGGTGEKDGACLSLIGNNINDSQAGEWELSTTNGTTNYNLRGTKDGKLAFNNRYLPLKVNETYPDSDGNVSIAIPSKTSELTNDSGYLTQHQSLAGYLKTTDVSKVATSGNYNDLSNKPALATVATSGSYNDLSNKPTIPDVSGKVDKSALATVATSGSYDDLKDKPTIPTVDTALDAFSTNPVQNKVVRSELVKKVDKETLYSGWEMMGSNSSLTWSLTSGDSYYGSINATNYTGTSAKATADGDGNTISTTYAKLASENTWSALQTFNSFKATTEKYNIAPPLTISGDFVPTHAVEFFTASGTVTIDLTLLAYALANNEAMVCTCVISSLTPYGLIIKGADNVVAIGSIEDIAIGEKGTMLNIILRKENNYSYALVQGTSLAWW